jgi:hypothetical protein
MSSRAPAIAVSRAALAAVTLVGIALLVLVGACNSIMGFAEGEAAVDEPVTGGGGGAATTGGGGTSSTGGSGAAAGGELCWNGIDDDGDDLADCADPKCTAIGFDCIEAPKGLGPAYVASRPLASPTASCPAGFTRQTLYQGLTYDALVCTCGCGQPSSADCSVTGHAYTNAGCSGTSHAVGPGCNSVEGDASYQASVSLLSGGSCQTTVSAGGVPATGWTTAFDVCVADPGSAGCDTGTICAPPPPPGFGTEICSLLAAGASCEAPFEQIELLGSEQIVDDRECTTTGCNCGTAVGQSCQARGGLVTYGVCGSGGLYVGKNLGPCESIGSPTELYLESPTSDGGYCPVSGSGTATGQVQAADEHNLCCMPETQ